MLSRRKVAKVFVNAWTSLRRRIDVVKAVREYSVCRADIV